MKILHISKYYFPFRGGIEQIARICVNSLKAYYEQKVICFNNIKEDKTDTIDGIEVTRCGVFATIASQGLSISIRRKLKEIIVSFKPDVIIFHYPNLFVARYLLKFISINTKLVVYWHHDIIKQKFLKMLFVEQNKRLIDRASVLIATSPAYVKGSSYLSSSLNKIKVIPNCIDDVKFQNYPEVEAKAAEIREANRDKIICLAVGRLVEHKGFKYLIQAAHLLDDNFKVYIIGNSKEIDNLLFEAGDDKKIHFLGLVDDVELKAYMTAMDIFCFPSITKNEACGLALAEAMYYGKPAVTFTIAGSGVNYVCINGENGIEVPNRDVKSYVSALKKLAADENLRHKLGTTVKKRVEENFLITQFEQNIRKVISEI